MQETDSPITAEQFAVQTSRIIASVSSVIDGKPDAQEGRFRLRGIANGTPNGPGVEWSANNSYGRGAAAPTASGAGNTRDEEQVITLTAIYKMNQ